MVGLDDLAAVRVQVVVGEGDVASLPADGQVVLEAVDVPETSPLQNAEQSGGSGVFI